MDFLFVKGAFRPWDRLSQIMVLLYLKDASSSPLHEYHKKNLEKAIIFAKNTKNRAQRCLKCGYLAENYRKVPSDCILAFERSANFCFSLLIAKFTIVSQFFFVFLNRMYQD